LTILTLPSGSSQHPTSIRFNHFHGCRHYPVDRVGRVVSSISRNPWIRGRSGLTSTPRTQLNTATEIPDQGPRPAYALDIPALDFLSRVDGEIGSGPAVPSQAAIRRRPRLDSALADACEDLSPERLSGASRQDLAGLLVWPAPGYGGIMARRILRFTHRGSNPRRSSASKTASIRIVAKVRTT
jgi:hypothetical protein